MQLKIEKVFAHVLEMSAGFTYSRGVKHSISRAIVWEVVADKWTGIGESTCSLEGSQRNAPKLTAQMCQTLKPEISNIVTNMLGRPAWALEALLPDMPAKMNWAFLVLREGLSIALYDLVGKACGLPAHALLGGKRRERAPGMPVVHTGPPDVMVRRSKAWVDAGYRYLKIKPPGYLKEDIEALKAIRHAVGDDILLQVDGNLVYETLEEAEQVVRAMQSFGVEVFEDMLKGSLEQIALLRQKTGARIMVDHEGSWPLVYEVCRSNAADIVNHHPNNQGGLMTVLQIDAVAASAGISTSIGSSGRFGIQNAAFQTLSSVVGITRPCEDIGLIPYYSGPTKGEYQFSGEPSVVKNPYPIVNGDIHIPDKPGLGIDLDRKRLESFTVDTICFE